MAGSLNRWQQKGLRKENRIRICRRIKNWKKEHLAIVTLKKGEGRTIKAGGAWIFDNEIASVAGHFEMGILCWYTILTAIPWERALSIRILKSAASA